jgi:hypothetical protein
MRGKGKAAAAPEPQVPAKGAGKKASGATSVARTADQEATHPMQTRGASRAVRLRGVGGSGEKDTCVASSHPSKT